MLTKEYLTNCLGNLSQKMYFYPGSLVFYQRYLENTVYYSQNENEERANKIMDNLNKLIRAVVGLEDGKKKGIFLGDYNMNDISVPIVDNTSILVIVEVPLTIIVSLLIATFLNSIKVLKGFYQTIFFLPYVTNTIALTPEKMAPKIKQLSVGQLFGEGIMRIIDDRTLSELFRK